MTDTQRGQIVIPSKLSEVTAVQERIISLIETLGYSKEAVFAVRLALDEAVSNAIRHGNGGDVSKQVTIDFDASEQQLTVKVCDQGSGFQPDDLADPTREENLTEPHGRGVMLMRAYMTEVHFNDSGNCVTMVKMRNCKKPYDQ